MNLNLRGKIMCKYLWVAVEADEYELPLAVAETATELGEMIGVNHRTIRSCISQKFNGRQSGRKYMKVRIDDELVE